jgi:hypothetical protein
MFLTRGFEDEVLLIAMALLLDAYMQWFHTGSYRLIGHFSQRGGLVQPKGWAAFGQKHSTKYDQTQSEINLKS